MSLSAGFPSFFVGRKLAVCVMDDEIGLRVPPDEDGLRPFERKGRRMNGWSLLTPESAEELRGKAPLLLASLEAAARAG